MSRSSAQNTWQRRRIVSYESMPGTHRRRMTLECGHVVERSHVPTATCRCDLCRAEGRLSAP